MASCPSVLGLCCSHTAGLASQEASPAWAGIPCGAERLGTALLAGSSFYTNTKAALKPFEDVQKNILKKQLEISASSMEAKRELPGFDSPGKSRHRALVTVRARALTRPRKGVWAMC